MTKVLLAGLGGFLGSSLRYVVGGWVHRMVNGSLFPLGTLVINATGCLVIGFLAGLAETRGVFSGEARVFLLIGVLGGYTTFSTFGYETFQLLRDGQVAMATSSMLLQIVLGIAGVWTGSVLSRIL